MCAGGVAGVAVGDKLGGGDSEEAAVRQTELRTEIEHILLDTLCTHERLNGRMNKTLSSGVM